MNSSETAIQEHAELEKDVERNNVTSFRMVNRKQNLAFSLNNFRTIELTIY